MKTKLELIEKPITRKKVLTYVVSESDRGELFLEIYRETLFLTRFLGAVLCPTEEICALIKDIEERDELDLTGYEKVSLDKCQKHRIVAASNIMSNPEGGIIYEKGFLWGSMGAEARAAFAPYDSTDD